MFVPALALLAIPLLLLSGGDGAADGEVRLRRLRSWPDGWVATELCSPAAASIAFSSLRLPFSDLASRAGDRLFRFAVVVRDGSSPERACLVVYRRDGASWRPIAVYGARGTLPDAEQRQHVNELSAQLGRDLGAQIAAESRQMSPDESYEFLRRIIRKPALAAEVVSDDDFRAEVVRVVSLTYPDRVTDLARRERESLSDVITYDGAVRPPPLVAQTHRESRRIP